MARHFPGVSVVEKEKKKLSVTYELEIFIFSLKHKNKRRKAPPRNGQSQQKPLSKALLNALTRHRVRPTQANSIRPADPMLYRRTAAAVSPQFGFFWAQLN